MSHKEQAHKSIATGLVLILTITSLLWWLLLTQVYEARVFLGLYSLPLIFSISIVVLKRYSSSELINGAYNNDDAIKLESAINQNNVEQTLVSVLVVLSFSAITPMHLSKLIPIHLVLFLIGRSAFMLGYRHAPMHRLVGFVVSHYINIILLVMSLYVYINA